MQEVWSWVKKHPIKLIMLFLSVLFLFFPTVALTIFIILLVATVATLIEEAIKNVH